MKKIYVVILLEILLAVKPAPADQWSQKLIAAGFNAKSVYFLNLQTGYVCGGNGLSALVYYTVDGGNNWVTRTTYTSTNGPSTFNKVYLEDSYGYTVGTAATRGIWFLTTNGGTSWQPRGDDPCQSQINSFFKFGSIVFFVDNYLQSQGGYQIWKSTNYGFNWNPVTSPSGYSWKLIAFNSSGTGYAIRDGNQDKFNNWGTYLGTQSFPPGNVADFTTYFNNFILLRNDSNLIYSKSIDYGSTWTDFFSDTTVGVNFSFQDSTMFILGRSVHYPYTNLWKSTNAGVNWSNVNPDNFAIQNPASVFFKKIYAGNYTYTKTCIIAGNYLYCRDSTIITGIKPISNSVPARFELFQNYPNPFNPSTTIEFSLPLIKGARGMDNYMPGGEVGVKVNLSIFDITGREVATLVNESLSPGKYKVVFDASQSRGSIYRTLTSGIYFYKLSYGDFTQTKKMILIK